MLKFVATNVGVSKGFQNNPAVSFSKEGNVARFRIGAKVYDKKADNNSRWVNITVKAFGQGLCERIRKMELKEGSMINLIGRYDEDTWTDEETKEKKSMPVVILDDLEFCFSGGKRSDGGQSASGNGTNHAPAPGQSYGYGAPQYGGYAPAAAPGYPPAEDSMPGNFTGFEPFGSGSNFFDE